MPRNTEADFWARGLIKEDTGCLIWQGSKDAKGYGYYSLVGKTVRPHRYAWKLANKSEIPKDKVVMHSCDNPSCFNPAHLSLGTSQDNAKDMVAKGRGRKEYPKPTHCIRGHEFTPENTIASGPDNRHKGCKQCAELRRHGLLTKVVNRPPQTHCRRGHELTPENKVAGRSNACRTCANTRGREGKARRKAAKE